MERNKDERLSRRDLLRWSALIGVPALLATCQRTISPAIDQTKTPTTRAHTSTPPPQPYGEEPNATSPPSISGRTWLIQCVDSMKETKDRVRNQRPDDFIRKWLDAAHDIGATHVAIDTPIDDSPGSFADDYTERWLRFARERNLLIYHRHPFLSFEGIYDRAKNPNIGYAQMYADYVVNHPHFFQPGDIFSIPEPQNGGIKGVTSCFGNICIFPDINAFNQFISDFMNKVNAAFAQVGLGGKVRVGYFGFDGFVTAGLNNPDWIGKSQLTPEAVEAMDNIIAIDHYSNTPQDMAGDLAEIQKVWPDRQLFIGEWGATRGEDTKEIRQVMEAFRNAKVLGVNYWQMGMGGYEALIEEDFSHKPSYDEIKAWYHGQR